MRTCNDIHLTARRHPRWAALLIAAVIAYTGPLAFLAPVASLAGMQTTLETMQERAQ